MEKNRLKLDIDSVKPYLRNMNVFFEGIEGGFLDRAAKKLAAVSSKLLRERCAPVFSERIIETPLVFQQVPRGPLNILDFGCAESLQPMQLCALGHTVTGLDFRPYPFTHKNFRFVQADILDWKPSPETFDIAVSVSTVEHVGLGAYGDPAREGGDKIAVGKLRDSLKTGGTMLLTVPAGKKCVRRGMRIYDHHAVESLVPDIEQVRYFRKAGRFSDWEEVTESEIGSLTYEDYEAVAPAQGLAFIVSRKT
jgi:hypothetical protein